MAHLVHYHDHSAAAGGSDTAELRLRGFEQWVYLPADSPVVQAIVKATTSVITWEQLGNEYVVMAHDFEMCTCLSAVYAHRLTRQPYKWELASLHARKGLANLEFLVGKGLDCSTVATIRQFVDRVKALTKVHKDAPELCVSSVNDLYLHHPYPLDGDYAGSNAHVVVDDIKWVGSLTLESVCDGDFVAVVAFDLLLLLGHRYLAHYRVDNGGHYFNMTK